MGAGQGAGGPGTPCSARTTRSPPPTPPRWPPGTGRTPICPYVNDAGYTVDTAAYGAGAWQVTATDYDTTGHVVRTLDPDATSIAAAAAAGGTPLNPASVNAMSTQTFYTSTGLVTDVYAPTRQAGAADNPLQPVRPHTATWYDQGAPNGGVNPATGTAYNLPTTIVSNDTETASAALGTVIWTDTITLNGYAPILAGDGDGWALGQASTVTQRDPWAFAPGPDVITTTRTDPQGRVIETRQPGSDGTDAGTTSTAYYSTGAQAAPNTSCGNHPGRAGLVCRTYPAASSSSGAVLPSTTTTYTMWLQPDTTTETAGTATRTTSHGYDTAARPTRSAAAATIPGSTPQPGTYTHYDPGTGLVDHTGPVNATHDAALWAGRTATAYDLWGRATTVTTYLDQSQPEDTTTTGYDTAGRVHTVTTTPAAGSAVDPQTTTYTYDGTDATGATEHRGLTTAMTITRGGTAGTLTYTAAYDTNARLVRQDLPGAIIARTSYDAGGNPTQTSYSGQVTDATTGAVTPDQPWLVWTMQHDGLGRVIRQYNGAGAAFDATSTTTDPVGAADAADRMYGYDYVGRLTQAVDRLSTTPGQATITPDTWFGSAAPCTVRQYTYDTRGNRTGTTSYDNTDGNCFGTANPTTTSYHYDTADRPRDAADTTSYTYDPFGRATTIPAADTPGGTSSGDITLTYYDSDLAHTITAGTTTTSYSLDAAGRRHTATTTDTATGTTTTQTLHYTNDGDTPDWTATTTPTGTTGHWDITDLAGNTAATTTPDGDTTLMLADPHGDIATTIDIPATQPEATPATAITGWNLYTEYGQPTTAPGQATTPTTEATSGYGWLGAKGRLTPTSAAGLTLMGDRLYNAVRGLFTSTDPEPGGNTTPYTYPQDPINKYDLNGHWSWRKAAKIAGFAALGVCIIASAGACAVAGAVAFTASFMSNRHDYRSGAISRGTFWRRTAVDAALAFVPAGRSVRLVGGHAAARSIGKGFWGTARALRRALTKRTGYVGRHRGGWQPGAALRHSWREFRGNWAVHPDRMTRRLGYGGGAFAAGNEWG